MNRVMGAQINHDDEDEDDYDDIGSMGSNQASAAVGQAANPDDELYCPLQYGQSLNQSTSLNLFDFH